MLNTKVVKKTSNFGGNNEPGPVIDVTGLRFTWQNGGAPVLDIDHFRVDHGELLFVIGASGSGKSTLLGILTGILLPQQGEVKVLGQIVSHMRGVARDRFRADNIGYIFQMFNLIPYLSVVENVVLPCRFSSSRKTKALLQSSSLNDEARRLLAHLNLKDQELLDKPVVELSVGQQQRVAAARALIGSPDLVIADEPTSSLDTEHRQSFLRLLFDECSRYGATLVFVSHDTSLAPLFNRVADFKQINAAAGVSGGGSA